VYNPALIMLANLRALFGVFVDIMFLRRGPEQLPASRMLLAIIGIVHVVVHSIADHVFLAPFRPGQGSAVPSQVLATVFMMVWFQFALRLAGKPERFVQTMIAVFFVSLLSVLMYPLLAAMLPYAIAAQESPTTATPAPGSLVLLAAIMTFWIIAMLARVVKSAFEWSWPATILFVLMSSFGVPLLLGLIFSGVSKAA